MAAPGNLSRAVRIETGQEVEGRYRHVKADAIEKHRFGRTIKGASLPHLHLPPAESAACLDDVFRGTIRFNFRRDAQTGGSEPLWKSGLTPVGVSGNVSRIYCKILDLVSGLERGSQPARLLSPARPGFRRLIWISVLREDARIFSPLVDRALSRLSLRGIEVTPKLREPFLELSLFRGKPSGQNLANLLVELP